MTRLVSASRGDPLSEHLFAALGRRYSLVGQIDAELRSWQRLRVALGTFRPEQRTWRERFYKSLLGNELRSRNAAEALARIERPFDAVVQVHALFRTTGAPYVVYVDNTHHQSAEGWAPWNPLVGRELERWYAFERATYQGAAHLFTMGEPAARSLTEFYGLPAARVTNVGAGANVSATPPLAPCAEPVILFVGNDFQRKGGEVLLAAFQLLRERLPTARLKVVGDGGAGRLAPGVEFLGRVRSSAELSRLYGQASLFCLPSLFDPFPLVLLEAMAHGLPCVSTRVCGIPEQVIHGETGLLVPPGDAAALAEALARVLERPAYGLRLGAAGRARVAGELSWDQVVARMAPVLDGLCYVRHPRPRRDAPAGVYPGGLIPHPPPVPVAPDTAQG